MGINMDIRNETDYEFLDLRDLDDGTKNEILAILRPNTGLDNFKLPWDIGEKRHKLDADVAHIHAEDVSDQWQQYGPEDRNLSKGMTEDPTLYDQCMTTSPMIATTMPSCHHYGGQMINVFGDAGFSGVGHPFGNDTGNDPNAYPLVGEFPYGYQQHPVFTATIEMMNEQLILDNETCGGCGRGDSGNLASGKRQSYNRAMNSNNDMQTSYALQNPDQYGRMMSSGPIYSFTPTGHPPAATQFFLSGPNPAYPQAPQMSHTVYSHNSLAGYSPHSSTYPNHPHTPSNTNYRGSQGHATYYNQETMKNPVHKYHEKRGYHPENSPAPSFRHTSNTETDASSKRTYVKPPHLVNSNAISDLRNKSVHNSSTAKHSRNDKKVAVSTNDIAFEKSCEIDVKPKVLTNVVDIDKPISAAIIDNNTVVAGAEVNDNKDKVESAHEVPFATEQTIVATKAQPEIQNPPRISKLAENMPELNEPRDLPIPVKNKKPNEETRSVKILETPRVPLPLATTVPASSDAAAAPPPSGKSWASVVLTGASSGDTIRSSLPITKISAGPVIPLGHSPTLPAETVVIHKTHSQETNIQPRNDNAAPSPIRNNADPYSKSTGSSPWTETKVPVESPQRENLNDPAVFRIGELLVKYQMDKQTVSLLPRGLTNRSNYCYINSILQALLACPPFYNLLMALPYPRKSGINVSTPLIDNMARFVREFSPLAEGARLARKDRSQKRGEETAVDIHFGVAFEPFYVYTMLKNASCAGVFSVEGRQEDAEEFLSCLLNGISDEMLELMKLVNAESNEVAPDNVQPNVNHNSDEEGWKVMGPKNKGSITRCTEFGRTPLSDIFRGQLRSRVIRVQDESTDNVQPFFTLQLDIEKAESVEGALETLFDRDRVEGMTCSKTKQQIEAWKQVSLEELPVILILHLKWFDYKLDGCSKIVKRVGFPIDLKLDSKKLLSPNLAKKLIRKQNHYKLFAVTYHDGKEASKGHYVTDAFHVGYGAWVRYDDSSVKGINEMDVLNPSPPRVPYLLYYRRFDTIGNNLPNTHRTR